MAKTDKIREQIRTINPNITDELLDLLYEFILAKHTEDIANCLKNNPDIDSIFQYVLNPVKREKN